MARSTRAGMGVFGSSFDSAEGEALGEVALAVVGEPHHRQRHKDGHGHHLSPSGVAAGADEAHHSEGKGLHVLRFEVKEREEQVVPGPGGDEYDLEGQDRLGEGQDDTPVNAEFIAAVDAGGVGEFIGDGAEELAQHKDHCGIERQQRRDDCRQPSSDPGHTRHHHIAGHHCHHVRDKHEADVEQHQQLVAPKFHAGEGIGRQRTRNHGWHTDEDGEHEGIAQVEQPVSLSPTVDEVLESDGIGDPLDGDGDAHLLQRLEGGTEHPAQGHQRDGQKEGNQQIGYRVLDEPTMAHSDREAAALPSNTPRCRNSGHTGQLPPS